MLSLDNEKFDRTVILILLIFAFLIAFRTDPIPFNTDDFAIIMWTEYLVENPSLSLIFSGGDRPLHRYIYMPIFVLNNFNPEHALLPTSLLSALIYTLLIFVNYKLVTRIYGKEVSVLSSFFLLTTFVVIYNVWYFGSAHINIGTLFLIACVYVYLKVNHRRDLYLGASFCALALFSRETLIFSLFLVTLTLVLTNEKIRSDIRNYLIVFSPFILFGIQYIFAKYTHSPMYPIESKIVLSWGNLKNIWIYTDYFKSTFFLPIILFALVLWSREILENKSLRVNIGKEEKFMLSWLLGGIIPLLVTNFADIRYIIPILPIIFAVVSAIIYKKFVGKLKKSMFNSLSYTFILILAYMLLFYNFGFFLKYVQDIDTLNFTYNVLFYSIVSLSIAYPLYETLKSTKNAMKMLKSVLFIILTVYISLYGLIQMATTYNFYIVHYDHSEAAFDAYSYIAREIPENARIFVQQDLSWVDTNGLVVFDRTDIKLEFDLSKEPKHGDFFIHPSRVKPTFKDMAKENDRFSLMETFGREYRKFPRSSIDKSRLFSTMELFYFYHDPGGHLQIYKYT